MSSVVLTENTSFGILGDYWAEKVNLEGRKWFSTQQIATKCNSLSNRKKDMLAFETCARRTQMWVMVEIEHQSLQRERTSFCEASCGVQRWCKKALLVILCYYCRNGSQNLVPDINWRCIHLRLRRALGNFKKILIYAGWTKAIVLYYILAWLVNILGLFPIMSCRLAPLYIFCSASVCLDFANGIL